MKTLVVFGIYILSQVVTKWKSFIITLRYILMQVIEFSRHNLWLTSAELHLVTVNKFDVIDLLRFVHG